MEELDAAEMHMDEAQPLQSHKRKAGRDDRDAQGKRQKNRAAAPASAASTSGAGAAAAAAAVPSNGHAHGAALDPAIAIAADAARDKLAARQAAQRAAAAASSRAASGQLGGMNPQDGDDESAGVAAAVAAESAVDAGAHGSNEAAPTDDDQLFYRYTEQHVSVAAKVENANGKSALSEVCYPPGWDMSKDASGIGFIRPAKPAKEYKFELDPFQRYAVDCLERNQSVLVSAHTSAGKTVVAEYAIAMALRDGARVIYTSPIKALSNQKYRELQEEFGDVGLMTGDVTINPSASCLVMTTEILRNMLYHGGEVMREARFVIFDEVHYMRNKERGVVWEETIIMLPDAVRYVFLSATIPNGTEFALWIAKLHKQPCSVVYTDFRPTPLQHYVFPAGGEGLYLVQDDKGNFREDNFQKALAVLKADGGVPDAGASGGGDKGKGGGGGAAAGGSSKKKKGGGKPTGPSDIFKIVQTVKDNENVPVIVFSFSKRECEQHALQMSAIDFNSEDEKACVDQVFTNAMAALSEGDRHLPQVENILPLLRRGIGIHHGGLLPILKEVVEILFQSELLKVLFSTETFSMGLNMPCKTVVFTSVKKWDGDVFRVVTGGEYIQMSGRAGRRGIDDRGIVICMMDEQLEPVQAKAMIKGQSDALDSSFHLGYNMLLNLLRSEDQNPAKMMSRSFLQFQNTRKAPKLIGELEVLQAQREGMSGSLTDAKAIKEYHDLLEQLELYRGKSTAFIMQPQFVERFLNPGRVVHVKSEVPGQPEWGWGILVSYTKNTVAKESRGKMAQAGPVGTTVYVLSVLLHCAPGSGVVSVAASKKNKARLPQNQKALFTPAAAAPASERSHSEWLVVPVALGLVDVVSQVKSNIANRNMADKTTRAEMGGMLNTLVQSVTNKTAAAAAPAASSKDGKKKSKHDKSAPAPAPAAAAPSGAPDVTRPLDPIADMKITDPEFLDLQRKVSSLQERLSAHKYSRAGAGEDAAQQLALYKQRSSLDAQILSTQLALKAANEDVNMKAQLRKMKTVLHRLGFTDAAGVVTAQKGSAACQISTSDELLVTQLMFEGVFAPLTPAQTVALCSALVFNEKSDDAPRLKEELAGPLRQLQDQARRVGQVQAEAGLALDVEEYVAGFQAQLMEVVYAWCAGASFSDVCKLTDVFEGTIIRCLRRLEELLRQLASAAKSIGDAPHEAKFTAGCALLKRDIVFAASLYL